MTGAPPRAAAAQPLPERRASTRRDVIKQRLPGEPERDISLVEVNYPPGTGSPPHSRPAGGPAVFLSHSRRPGCPLLVLSRCATAYQPMSGFGGEADTVQAAA